MMKNISSNSEDLSPKLAKIILLITLAVQMIIVLAIYWFYLKYQAGLGMLLTLLGAVLVIWQWHNHCQKLFKRVDCIQCKSSFFNRVSQLFKKGIHCTNCYKQY